MRRPLAASLAAAALLAAGCKNDFAPQSDLLGLRVMALVADHPELAPGQAVTITPTEYVPAGAGAETRAWTFCPLSAGSVAAYACAVPQCEVVLPADPTTHAVTANPSELVRACLGGSIPPNVPEPIVTVFRYALAKEGAGERVSVLQVPAWLRGTPPNPNHDPVILGVDFGGVPAVEGQDTPPLPVGGVLPVTLRIDPASAESYVDAAGLPQTETLTGYFYTTAGTFSAGVTTGATTTSDLEGTGVPDGATHAQVWVVALDLRGGAAVRGPFSVPIRR